MNTHRMWEGARPADSLSLLPFLTLLVLAVAAFIAALALLERVAPALHPFVG